MLPRRLPEHIGNTERIHEGWSIVHRLSQPTTPIGTNALSKAMQPMASRLREVEPWRIQLPRRPGNTSNALGELRTRDEFEETLVIVKATELFRQLFHRIDRVHFTQRATQH